MLSARTSSWPVCSVHTSVPDPYAQGAHQFLMRMLSMFWRYCALSGISSLTRMLSARTSSWLVCSANASVPDAACSACAWVPDPYAQRAHNGRSMRVRNSIFSTIFKVPKTAKILKNRYWHQHMVSKAFQKNFFFVQTQQKSLLKIRLSIRVRNFAAPNEPLNILFKTFYFNPKVALPKRLNGVKIMKIRAIENLTLGHL